MIGSHFNKERSAVSLSIYNSLTKEKTLFKPLRGNEVSLYVCGMTVYDYCHIGHARLMLVFDMVTRYLRALGYDLTYVQNITDIDDKIIKRANENGESCSELTERFIVAMHEDLDALGILRPDQQPRATQCLSEMIALVEQLIEKGIAYVASSGDVLYSVKKFEGYGKLSKRKLDDLRAGERITVSEDKQDPLDFVLWKAAKEGEPSWESPWGPGRPGWHLECSAMAMSCLHKSIDIHGGGMDLMFPHHENEIAQSEACTGQQFVNNWMHIGFLQIDNEKMSKSLGNFFLVREALQKFQPEQIRFFMLSSHYRRPLNYSEENLQHAQDALTRFYSAMRGLEVEVTAAENTEFEAAFHKAMQDDFNTPEAIAVLFNLAREINKQREENKPYAEQLVALLKKLGAVLGLFSQTAEMFFQANSSVDAAYVEQLIVDRRQARADKDWGRADEIRDELDAMGIVLEDSANGTTWKVK
jgi:cysteinyl-tRNA synthetase